MADVRDADIVAPDHQDHRREQGAADRARDVEQHAQPQQPAEPLVVIRRDMVDAIAHHDLPGLEPDDHGDRLRRPGDQRESAEVGHPERSRRDAQIDQRQHRDDAAARHQPAEVLRRRANALRQGAVTPAER